MQTPSAQSLSSQLITDHLKATRRERQISPGVIVLAAVLLVLPVALLLVSSAIN